MTPKQYQEIRRALTRFKQVIYFEESLRKWKNIKFLQTDKVVVSRAIMSLQELKQEDQNGKDPQTNFE